MKDNLIIVIVFILGTIITNAQTKIIAHRGFSGMAPENTLIAFQKAIESKADYIELDVRKTKNDTLVVIHDTSLDRTSSDGIKGIVAELNYSELSDIKVGYPSKFNDQFIDEKIPTLREVLQLTKGKIKVCIEIKVQGIEAEVLKIVNDLEVSNEIIIFSFYLPVITKIKQLDKNILTLLLINKADSSIFEDDKRFEWSAIGVGYGTTVTKEFIESAHKNGIEVWKWTVNDKDKMVKLIDLGIDGIITNYPDKAIGIIDTKYLENN